MCVYSCLQTLIVNSFCISLHDWLKGKWENTKEHHFLNAVLYVYLYLYVYTYKHVSILSLTKGYNNYSMAMCEYSEVLKNIFLHWRYVQ